MQNLIWLVIIMYKNIRSLYTSWDYSTLAAASTLRGWTQG